MEAKQTADKCGFSLCTAVPVTKVLLDCEVLCVCRHHFTSLPVLPVCAALSEIAPGQEKPWDSFQLCEDSAKQAEDLNDMRSAAKWWRRAHTFLQVPPIKRTARSPSDLQLKKPRI